MEDGYDRKYHERRMRAGCVVTWVDGSFTFFLVGVGCFMAAFIAPNWSVDYRRYTNGLWLGCSPYSCWSTDGDMAHTSLKYVQALMCFALMATMVALILFGMYLSDVATDPQAVKNIRVIHNVLQLVAGILVVIGCIVYATTLGKRGGDYLEWAFMLAISSAVIFILNSVINLLLMKLLS